MELDVPSIARHQRGAFTRGQALAEGWSRRQIGTRLARGHWQVVAGDALARTGSVTAGTRAWAVHLTWPDAVLSHLTAAELHRFPVPAADVAHVICERLRPGLRGTYLHRLPLDPADVVSSHGGPRITAERRTAVDLLRWLPAQEGLDLFAWFTTRGVLTHADLVAEVERTPGRWGTPALTRIARLTAGGALSANERRMHDLLRRAGLTGWEANARVVADGRVIAVADILFARQRLVIELDGFAAHSDYTSFLHDRRRQNDLVNAGYRVLRFTWEDLTRRPQEVLRQIRAALAACA